MQFEKVSGEDFIVGERRKEGMDEGCDTVVSTRIETGQTDGNRKGSPKKNCRAEMRSSHMWKNAKLTVDIYGENCSTEGAGIKTLRKQLGPPYRQSRQSGGQGTRLRSCLLQTGNVYVLRA